MRSQPPPSREDSVDDGELPRGSRDRPRPARAHCMKGSARLEPPGAGSLAEKIHGLAPSHTYAPGVELFQQGAIVEDVYFVAGGLIKLVHFEPDGRELIIGLRFPGCLVGSSALLAEEPSLATAITLPR